MQTCGEHRREGDPGAVKQKHYHQIKTCGVVTTGGIQI